MTINTQTGRTYAVTSTAGCSVTDSNGLTLCTVDAGTQGYFVATGNTATVTGDDAAAVTLLFNNALRKLRLLAGGSKLLPSGYTTISYLESGTGGQYFIVDTLVDDNFGLLYDYQFANSATNGYPFDNRVSAASSLRAYRISRYGCKWYYDSLAVSEDGRALWKCNFLNDRKFSKYQYDTELYNEKALPIQNAIPISSFGFCGVFAHGADGSVTRSEGVYVRIYDIQMSYGADMVHALVPALDNSGKPCMFDTVSKQTYYNAGTGDFIAGIDTTAQINTLLHNLPDLTGQEAKTLQIRLADSIRTEEMEAYITAQGTAKNWLISHAA